MRYKIFRRLRYGIQSVNNLLQGLNRARHVCGAEVNLVIAVNDIGQELQSVSHTYSQLDSMRRNNLERGTPVNV